MVEDKGKYAPDSSLMREYLTLEQLLVKYGDFLTEEEISKITSIING